MTIRVWFILIGYISHSVSVLWKSFPQLSILSCPTPCLLSAWVKSVLYWTFQNRNVIDLHLKKCDSWSYLSVSKLVWQKHFFWQILGCWMLNECPINVFIQHWMSSYGMVPRHFGRCSFLIERNVCVFKVWNTKSICTCTNVLLSMYLCYLQCGH